MTPAGWRQQVSKHSHTDAHIHTFLHAHIKHIVYCILLSPVRVMILLYLHGFSYIDLDQEAAPPTGAPFHGSPRGSYCVCVCMCAKYQQLVCQQQCAKRKKKKRKKREKTRSWISLTSFKSTNQTPRTLSHTQTHTNT